MLSVIFHLERKKRGNPYFSECTTAEKHKINSELQCVPDESCTKHWEEAV